MRLLPLNSSDNSFDVDGYFDEMPSLTYELDIQRSRLRKYIDKQDAMKQSIFKCLQTLFRAHDIYDDQYGFEAQGLLGKDMGFVQSELKRKIREALLVDRRIIDVWNFRFEFDAQSPDSVLTHFKVKTRFGDFDLTEGVIIKE